jgi:hypothetical protein
VTSLYLPQQQDDPILRDEFENYAVASNLDVLGTTFEETLYYNPFVSISRGMVLKHQKTQGKQLSKDEWSESEFYRNGLTYPEEGLSEGAARVIAESYDERESRKQIFARGQSGFAMGAAKFGVGVVGSFLDPLNVGSVFLPGAAIRSFVNARRAVKTGEAVTKGKIIQESMFQTGKTTRRFGMGALEGAIGTAPLEIPILAVAEMEQDKDYTLLDSFLNVTIGSFLGGGIHAVGGKFSDRLQRIRKETQELALRSSITQNTMGQRTNIREVLEADPSYEKLKYDPRFSEPQIVNFADQKSVTQTLDDLDKKLVINYRRKGRKLPSVLNPVAKKDTPKSLAQWLRTKKVNSKSTDINELDTLLDKGSFAFKSEKADTLDIVIRDAVDAGYFRQEPSAGEFADAVADDLSGFRKTFKQDELDKVEAINTALEYKGLADEFEINYYGMDDDAFFTAIRNIEEANAYHESMMARANPYEEYGMNPEDFDTMMTKQMESEKALDIHIQTEGIDDIYTGAEPEFRDPELDQLNVETKDLETDIETLRNNNLLSDEDELAIKEADEGIERVDVSFREAAIAGARCIMRST